MRLVAVSVRRRINNRLKRFEIKILAKWLNLNLKDNLDTRALVSRVECHTTISNIRTTAS